jgi:hypothetical protein
VFSFTISFPTGQFSKISDAEHNLWQCFNLLTNINNNKKHQREQNKQNKIQQQQIRLMTMFQATDEHQKLHPQQLQ